MQFKDWFNFADNFLIWVKCIKKQLMPKNTFKKFSMDNFADESSKVLDEQGVQSVIIIKGHPRPTALGISS